MVIARQSCGARENQDIRSSRVCMPIARPSQPPGPSSQAVDAAISPSISGPRHHRRPQVQLDRIQVLILLGRGDDEDAHGDQSIRTWNTPTLALPPELMAIFTRSDETPTLSFTAVPAAA
jgi:hypothetical protein